MARSFPLSGNPPSRVVVLRALQIGDLLVAVPMFRALRRAFPKAHVCLVGLPWASWFVDRFSAYVDSLIAFPGLPGLPERDPDVLAFPAFLEGVQSRRFHLALQAHGSGAYVNTLVALFGAGRCAGFFRPGEFCPDAELFLAYPDEGTEASRLLRLVEPLGAPPDDDTLELPVRAGERRVAEAVLDAEGVTGPFVCIHPGGRSPSRRWPPDRFAAVADWLQGQGLRVLLTGSGEERGITAAVAAAAFAPVVDLAGRLGLGETAAIVERARLLVCNDTAVSHMAAALRVPSVVVTLGSDPERWASRDRGLHRAVWEPVACRPCAHAQCPIGHPCAQSLMPSRVALEARALLDAHAAVCR
jgi:ADP-heptose:LPS heptosyltransferase